MKSWTFESKEIASTFDSHVREQLPWYDMATDAVAYIVKNYLRDYGDIVDIGSSTGNMIDKLMPLIKEREADIYAIDDSTEMVKVLRKKYDNNCSVKISEYDVSEDGIPSADVYIVFLTMMFLPVVSRERLLDEMRSKVRNGGVIIIVDKVADHNGYFATVLKRLTMHWKLLQGAKPEDVLTKEMSLAGVQIPLDTDLIPDGKLFFRMGEFAGWVIESKKNNKKPKSCV
jgi:tRNA (cmo5U34)-methyltransferase